MIDENEIKNKMNKVIETLERELSKEHEVVKIDGSVSQEDRQNAVDRFQKGTANIFLGSIRACSEAICRKVQIIQFTFNV